MTTNRQPPSDNLAPHTGQGEIADINLLDFNLPDFDIPDIGGSEPAEPMLAEEEYAEGVAGPPSSEETVVGQMPEQAATPETTAVVEQPAETPESMVQAILGDSSDLEINPREILGENPEFSDRQPPARGQRSASRSPVRKSRLPTRAQSIGQILL